MKIAMVNGDRRKICWTVVTLLALTMILVIVFLKPASGKASATDSVDLKLLLICTGGDEPSCEAGRDVLERLGTPFTEVDAVSQEISQDLLTDGSAHAYYSGVILSTGDLVFHDAGSGTWQSALSDEEWQILRGFESRFSLREASLYTFPTAEYGLTYVRSLDTSATPLTTSLTGPGRELFSYLDPDAAITFRNAWGYASRPAFLAVPAGAETTPLITTADGLTVAALHHNSDGRVTLALCIDSNPQLTHSQALMYGIIRWVSRNMLLGERHVYLSPQIDDIFIGDESWDPETLTTLPQEYRMSGSDMDFIAAWQQGFRQSWSTASSFRLNMVFNGEGTTAYEPGDTLTPSARIHQADFMWTNHTYSHGNHDNSSYQESFADITANDAVAADLGLSLYDPAGLVTGDMSGLNNPRFMSAAADAGIRYVASNTSIAGQGNPSPNTGVVSPLVPSVLMVPRHPTNIFYNAVTPEQEVSEYNQIYRSYWGRDLTYEEILGIESDTILGYMLTYDIDPLMFHAGNLGVYESPTYGSGTLLTDLMDVTLAKYEALFDLPVLSLSHAGTGQKMEQRAAYDQTDVDATMGGGAITISASRACTVPVTGLSGINQEIYGGEPISYLDISSGLPVSAPVEGNLRLENRQPDPDSLINDGRPHIGLDYSDPAWSIDRSGVSITLDGVDVTEGALVTDAFISYVPADLNGGAHTVGVTVTSNSGQVSQTQWHFTNTSPRPVLTVGNVFWGSYADYLAGKLSVTYILENRGTGPARLAMVEGGTATNGIFMITPPMELGEISASGSAQFTLQYLLPPGISRFRATTFVTVRDDAGNVYGMPAPVS